MPYPKTPEGKFRHQKSGAQQRGISWELTFEEWWGIWQASGKWEQRGTRRDQYVMARYGDIGPYSLNNVRICTARENHIEADPARRAGIEKALKKANRQFRGWVFDKRRKLPYSVFHCCKYVGSFLTPEEADAAYRAACKESEERRAHESKSLFFARIGQP